MKETLSPLLALLLCSATPAWAGLDFTLQHKALPADGLALTQSYITDGSSKIFLRLPNTWKVVDSGSGLDCTPEIASSEVRLELFPGSKALTIDPAGGRDLLALMISKLPKEAKNVVAFPADLNSLPIFGWTTIEVTVTYQFLGQPMRRSMMYLNMLPGRMVTMTVVALAGDFDKVHKQARQVLSSWFEPSRDLPPDLQRKYESAANGG